MYYYSKIKEKICFIDVDSCDECESFRLLLDKDNCVIYHTSTYRYKKIRQRYEMTGDIDLIFCSAKCATKNYQNNLK